MECIDKDGSFPLAETWCAAFLYEARAVSSTEEERQRIVRGEA